MSELPQSHLGKDPDPPDTKVPEKTLKNQFPNVKNWTDFITREDRTRRKKVEGP
jgi:hypothetical protein